MSLFWLALGCWVEIGVGRSTESIWDDKETTEGLLSKEEPEGEAGSRGWPEDTRLIDQGPRVRKTVEAQQVREARWRDDPGVVGRPGEQQIVEPKSSYCNTWTAFVVNIRGWVEVVERGRRDDSSDPLFRPMMCSG